MSQVQEKVIIREHSKLRSPQDPCPNTIGILVKTEFGKNTYRCTFCQREGVIPLASPPASRA